MNGSENKKHVPYRDSKLTRMLEDCLGGNAKTTLVCMCSSEARNAVESVSTCRFGVRAKRVVNTARINVEKGVEEYKGELVKAGKREKDLTKFVNVLCKELLKIKKLISEGQIELINFDSPLWDSVKMILADANGGVAEKSVAEEETVEKTAEKMVEKTDAADAADDAVAPSSPPSSGPSSEHSTPPSTPPTTPPPSGPQVEQLQCALEALIEELSLRDETVKELQLDVNVSKEQGEEGEKERHALQEECANYKQAMSLLEQDTNAAKRELTNSQYKEKEATMFLRQMRKEYRRLQQQVSRGGMTVKPLEEDGEGVAYIDLMMKEAGLMEDEEEEEEEEEEVATPAVELAAVPPLPSSSPPPLSPPLLPPATGTKREAELMADITELTSKFLELRMQLEEEKSTVEMLSETAGKKKNGLANEAIVLRKALDRRHQDVQTALLKLQELHMMNRTLNRKIANREQHVSFLEDSLQDLQDAHRLGIVENSHALKTAQAENKRLQSIVDALTSGHGGGGMGSPNRVVVPIRGGNTGRTPRKNDSPEVRIRGRSEGEEGAAAGWSPVRKGAVPVMMGSLEVAAGGSSEAFFNDGDDDEDEEEPSFDIDKELSRYNDGEAQDLVGEDEDEDVQIARAAAATAKAMQAEKEKQKKQKRRLSTRLRAFSNSASSVLRTSSVGSKKEGGEEKAEPWLFKK